MNKLKRNFLISVASGALLLGGASAEAGALEPTQKPLTYTQTVEESSPISFRGIPEDKEKLKCIYNELSKTKEGQKVQQSLKQAHQATGNVVPVSCDHLERGMGAVYMGRLGGIKMNLFARPDEVMLGHELTHSVQDMRPLRRDEIQYSSIKGAFVGEKLLELETKVQDTVMFSQKFKTATPEETKDMKATPFAALVPLYQRFEQEGVEKFGSGEKAQKYAKTELAKTLWQDKNMPLTDVPSNIFGRNEVGNAYSAVGTWNSLYDNQAARNLNVRLGGLSFKKGAQQFEDKLFQQHIDAMGVDLTPEYLRENVSVDFGYTVKDDKFSYFLSPVKYELKETKDGMCLVGKNDNQVVVQNQFDKDGKCTEAKTFYNDGKVFSEGNVALGLDTTIYDSTGKVREKVQTNGLKTLYYDDSDIVFKQTDSKGKITIYNNPKGEKLPAEDEFKQGLNGAFYDYNQYGEVERISTYKDGKKNGLEMVDKNKCTYKNGLKDGAAVEFNCFGEERLTYKEGKKVGSVYNAKGKEISYYSEDGNSYGSKEEYEILIRPKKGLKESLKESSQATAAEQTAEKTVAEKPAPSKVVAQVIQNARD